MSGLTIGIDIGTGSTKGVLADSDGNVLHSEVIRHRTSFPRPGWAEHDADEIWWSDVVEICRNLSARAKGDVAGLCISGIGPVFQPANELGVPLRPAILYGVDTRAGEEINAQTERYGYDQILKVCGNPLSAQSVGPKIEWIKKNEPDVWAKTRRFFMAHTYCIFHLTGEYVLDHLSASNCEPLYSMHDTSWADEYVSDICEDLPMPRLVWANEIAGYITDNAARITGLPPRTPVAMGSIDAHVEALSVIGKVPGRMMLNYGSTMVVSEILDRPGQSETLFSLSGLFSGTAILCGAMSTGGSLTTWVCDLTGMNYDELTKLAAKSDPGANGLITLPYFSGERSPISDPDARGVMAGLALTHTKADLYRSVLESIGFGTRHMIESMEHDGGGANEYWAVGGGTNSDLWPQIVSDICGIKQSIPKVSIGASYGDAKLAAIAAGLIDPDTNWNKADREIIPNLELSELYGSLYQKYRELYPATADIVHGLAKIQK